MAEAIDGLGRRTEREMKYGHEIADPMVRTPDGKFAKGNVGGPGRPQGNQGRQLALMRLDKFLAKDATLDALEKGWKKALDETAIGFWKKIVEPLLPKELLFGVGEEEKAGLARAFYQALVMAKGNRAIGPGGNGGNDGGNGGDSGPA